MARESSTPIDHKQPVKRRSTSAEMVEAFTLYMTIAAFRTTLSTLGVFVFLTLTFFALAIANFTGASAWVTITGYLGVITAILAWYGSFAAVTNFTFKRVVIPVFPLAK